ncbi:MAG: AraC family transcriptional regulator [Verrucomicrobiota bacterium]
MDNKKAIFKQLQANILDVTANHFTAWAGEQTNMHLHPGLWHVTYTVHGRGICIVGGQKYHLHPGLIHIVYPNEIHKYRADKERPYTIYFLHIDCGGPIPEVFPRTIRASQLSRNTLKIFGQLAYLCHSALNRRHSIRMHALLGVLLADLIEFEIGLDLPSASTFPNKPKHAKFDDILERMRTPPFQYPGINNLASTLNMSRRSFTQYFRAIAGMAAREYYLKYRLNHAHMLMESGELRVKEIARQCGYANSQNFIRAYKKYRADK